MSYNEGVVHLLIGHMRVMSDPPLRTTEDSPTLKLAVTYHPKPGAGAMNQIRGCR
jgi:hypothetical protein